MDHDRGRGDPLIRGFAMDAPRQANSGHQGTAMALAPLAHVLYSRVMRHDPADPHWPDRDRFVLSNGHASILQYSMLYLSGYGLELDDLQAFRQWGSAHPRPPRGRPHRRRRGHHRSARPGLRQRRRHGHRRARTCAPASAPSVMDHHTFVIAGDGCLHGGRQPRGGLARRPPRPRPAHRASTTTTTSRSTATPTLAVSDDVGERFEAYGWHVEDLGEIANDLDALEAGAARGPWPSTDRPSLLVLRSHIGYPSPDLTDDHEAHGDPFTPEDVTRTKARHGHPRRAVLGARRRRRAPTGRTRGRRGAAAAPGVASAPRRARTATAAAWDAAGPAPAWPAGTTTCPRSSRARSSPPGRPSQKALNATLDDRARPRGRRRRPHRQHRHEARRRRVASRAEHPGGRQIHYGIREHAHGRGA